jgi:hypothetical protein
MTKRLETAAVPSLAVDVQGNFRQQISFVYDMPELMHARRQRDSLVIFAIAAVVIALAYWGVWMSLTAEAQKHPHAGVITHSTPVGGAIEDGIFRQVPESERPKLTRSRI